MLRLPLVLLVGSIVGSALYAGETEWPQFRGPGAQGISAAEHVPTKWSATEGIKWESEVPGQGWSSPVLSHGKLYLTTAVAGTAEEPATLRALCYDAADGKLVWNVEVFRPDAGAMAAMHRKNSPASATPIVADGRVYVHFGHMGTAALDFEGKVLWRQNGLSYSPTHGNGGSPALVGETLIFSGDGAPDPFVAGLNVKDGSIRWRTARHSTAHKPFSFCTPLAIQANGRTEVISPGSGFVGSYNPADGTEYWRVNYGEGYSVVPRPVFANGMLFVGTGFDAAWVYAIRPEGAMGDATATNLAWKLRKGAPLTPSMIATGNELYFVSDNGIASCVNAQTGDVYWSERLDGNYSASPILAEGKIYFMSETGVGSIVKADKTFQLLGKNELGERTLASYAVEDGALYVRSERHLRKIVGN